MDSAFASHLARLGGLTTTDVVGTLIGRRSFLSMVERHELVRVHRGVYRHAAVPVTLDLRLRAGLLAVGPGGMISHRAALARYGARNFECGLVELTHRSRSLPLRDGVVLHRSPNLHPHDLVVVDGLPTTGRARTLVDACSVLPPSLVGRYAQSWLAERRLRIDDLTATLDRSGNHPGAHRLRRQLLDVVAEADSPPEARLGHVLRRAGMPPELHVLVTTATGYTFELDWAYPAIRLGLEMDGYGVHLRSSAAFDDDRFRRNELEIAGWRILNFTTNQLRRPARVVDQVRRAMFVST